MEVYYYCQNCEAKITIEQLSQLVEGKCNECGSMEGFSTTPKSKNDSFESVTVINDAELLEKSFIK